MSSVIRPSGPLPPRVYWVRRTLALVVLVLVICLAWWLVGRVLGGDDAQAATATDGESAADTGSTPGEPTGGTSTAPGGDETEQGTGNGQSGSPHKHRRHVQAAPTGDCVPAEVGLTVLVRDAKAGADNPIKLAFTSLTTRACTLAVTPQTLALRVTSGDDVIWTSDDCPDEVLAREVVVRKRESTAYVFDWNGHRSTDTCAAPGQAPGAGGFWAEAALIGADAHKAYFDLT